MKEEIANKINRQDWKGAIEKLSECFQQGLFDEEIAIFAATIYRELGYQEKAIEMIHKGIEINYKSYELWLILGEVHEGENDNQAYLCYENALYFCEDEADKEVIQDFIRGIENKKTFGVKKCTIIINKDEMSDFGAARCIESIGQTCDSKIYDIKYKDSVTDTCFKEWKREEKDFLFLDEGVIFLPNTLFWLRMALYECENIGAVSPQMGETIGNFGYEKKIYLDSPVKLIRYEIMKEFIIWDEKLKIRKYRDLDLGLSIMKSGYCSVVCQDSEIRLLDIKNEYSFQQNQENIDREFLKEKWGFDPESYMNTQYDWILKVMDLHLKSPKILCFDTGLCGTLFLLEKVISDGEVLGVISDKALYSILQKTKNVIFVDDLEELCIEENSFDIILMDEFSDQSVQPINTLKKYGRYLKENGMLMTKVGQYTKNDIYYWDEHKEEIPSIALCIPTYNHPETIRMGLNTVVLNYALCGIDIYVYDSSEEDDTKNIVEEWIQKGYNNLYYIGVRDMRYIDKISEILSGKGLEKDYQYIWPNKDRTACRLDTLHVILENLKYEPDLLYMEVLDRKHSKEEIIWSDRCDLYCNHS